MNHPATSFAMLQARLLRLFNLRIANGEFTERGLARLIGVSQPQIHNVLKGKRKLQTDLADKIMQKFDLTVLDLFHETELREQLRTRASVHTRDLREPVTQLNHAPAELKTCPRKCARRTVARRSSAKDLAS